MTHNAVWLSPPCCHFLDPPIQEFYSTYCFDISLHLIAGNDSFCVSVVCPWTSYYCHSFTEVNRCLFSIADSYYGGIHNGSSRFTEKG